MARKALGPWTSKLSPKARGIAAGYRSGLEERVASELRAAGVEAKYEDRASVIHYERPSEKARYLPDFVLPNGIIIETKGRFQTEDRKKHKTIKAQHPHLDIRFVFDNPNQKISKTSETTYALWCQSHGFLYAKKSVPLEWIAEVPRNA